MQVVQNIKSSDDYNPDFDEDVTVGEDDTLAGWEVIEYTVPEWALCYLLDGHSISVDDPDLDDADEDIQAINSFLKTEGLNKSKGHWSYDSENSEAYFSWRNDITNLGGNCVDVQWVQRVE